MDWNLEGLRVRGLYISEIEVSGVVEVSRSALGNSVKHHIVLDKAVNVYGSERDRVLIDHENIIEVFTTDGRIPALGLTLVEDPGVNILYNVSATIRNETYEEAPEAFDGIVDAILAPLDNQTMAELNARVSAEGEEPAAVARDYLVQQGIIAG